MFAPKWKSIYVSIYNVYTSRGEIHMKMKQLLKKVEKGEITAEEFENRITKRYNEIKKEKHALIIKMQRSRDLVE